MVLAEELIFASEAHAQAAVASIDAAQGNSGDITWDIPFQIGSYWRISKPEDGSDSSVTDIVATQTCGYAHRVYLFKEDNIDADGITNTGGGILENEDG